MAYAMDIGSMVSRIVNVSYNLNFREMPVMLDCDEMSLHMIGLWLCLSLSLLA